MRFVIVAAIALLPTASLAGSGPVRVACRSACPSEMPTATSGPWLRPTSPWAPRSHRLASAPHGA